MQTSTTTPRLRRHFSTDGVDPYQDVEWSKRTAEVGNFRQDDVEFPTTWSQDAVNIVAQKYFRGAIGSPDREHSLKQVIDRVVNTIGIWAAADSTVAPGELATLRDELKALVLHQRFAFNSPVWFNLGVKGTPQQGSACFILDVEDNLPSILNWYREEGMIFKGGSGAGINLSQLRGSTEPLKGGGTASGPVSFMRGADASAGTIKSGGKTRRAAKMVILDDDHPDIFQFVQCKAREERKIRALDDAGFDMGVNGADLTSVQYQNANNSVRLSDDFMAAATGDKTDWILEPRGTAAPEAEVVDARELLASIAEAVHECADPGVQFSDTINEWHTLAAHSPIEASNPCSEYLSINNSACNLASLNLLKFINDDNTFDAFGFRQAVEIAITAMDAIAGRADYPTDAIADNTRKYRQLGLGYTNLGATLMALGLPYDSDAGRAVAASITALMTGEAYLVSGRLARAAEPFHAWHKAHQLNTLRVLERHHRHAADHHQSLRAQNGAMPRIATDIARLAVDSWDAVIETAETDGVRNSQATVLAPTGTISFWLDADTTGIEPDFALSKTKTLVGGGTMTLVNQSVTRALRTLGYEDLVIGRVAHEGSLLDNVIKPEHLPVFATSVGPNSIAPAGHLKMMAAVQPFISGAISKTVNVPAETSVGDIQDLIIEAHKLGIKCLAIYRDGSKTSQPLEAQKPIVPALTPVRTKLPAKRTAKTFSFHVGGAHGYVTTGEYENGQLGEIFLRVAKGGSTLAGIMDAFAIVFSHGLQYGVPLEAYVRALRDIKFEPAGITTDPEVRIATSIVDYVVQRLAIEYLDEERPPGQPELKPIDPVMSEVIGVICQDCGGPMIRSGTCFTCRSCASTSGCG